MEALRTLRTHIKEKELEALLAGDQDRCSCFIEVNLHIHFQSAECIIIVLDI